MPVLAVPTRESPSRAASPRTAVSVADRPGLEALLHVQADEQGLDQYGRLVRPGPPGPRPTCDGPAAQLPGTEAPGLGVRAPGGPRPPRDPGRPAATARARGGGSAPRPRRRRPPAAFSHTAANWRRAVGHGHLGEQHGEHGFLPVVEDGEKQPLLAAEVGVDGARGPLGGVGHRVDRHGVDPLLGEEVGGGGQQAALVLGLPFLLGLGHRSPGRRVQRRGARPYIYRERYATGMGAARGPARGSGPGYGPGYGHGWDQARAGRIGAFRRCAPSVRPLR